MNRVVGVLPLLLLLPACEKLPAAPELPNAPPTASFFYTPVSPIYTGQTRVSFDAQGSRDTDGKIMSYEWNFGDGTPMQTTTGPTTTHVFPDTPSRCIDVTYGVSLVVIDDKGDRGVSSENVTVVELPAPTAPECLPR